MEIRNGMEHGEGQGEGAGIFGDREKSESVFDRAALLARVDGSDSLVRRLVDMFIDSTSSHLSALQDAVTRRDASDIVFRAHTVAGMAANIGAHGMQRIAAELETVAKGASLADVPLLCLQLDHAFAAFQTVALNSARETACSTR